MGAVVTRFVYKTIEEALSYSSYYSDLLTSYKNIFDSTIYLSGDQFTLEYKIYDSDRREDNSGNSKGTRYLSEPSAEDSQDSV
jgi:hypothetical protein